MINLEEYVLYFVHLHKFIFLYIDDHLFSFLLNHKRVIRRVWSGKKWGYNFSFDVESVKYSDSRIVLDLIDTSITID